MPHTFYLDKPGDVLATFEKLKSKLAATGGKLTGNEKEGFISADGVEGNYTVEADTIKITVTKKPLPLIPNALVEKQIRGIFQELIL